MKRIIGYMLALIMLFGVFGLTACDSGGETLSDYKAIKSQALQDYADAKGEENYSTDGWQAICNAVADGKKEIAEATTKSAVTMAFEDAKAMIDEVKEEDVVGMFYTLQEAFNEGYLTKDDIMHISHFATGRVTEIIDTTGNEWAMELDLPDSYWTKIKIVDFTPQQTKPSLESLSKQIIVDMKVAFYKVNQVSIDNSFHSAISNGTLSADTTALETIVVQEFLGTYNGFYAVRITSTLLGYGGMMVSQLVSDIGWNLPSAPMITVFTI